MEKDTLTILNYPGSKKRLLDFITDAVSGILPEGKTVFDIFCGTSAVGYALKSKYRVLSNDSELFCYVMSKALMESNAAFDFEGINEEFFNFYNDNKSLLEEAYPETVTERNLVAKKDIEGLVAFYSTFYTVAQPEYVERAAHCDYRLFTAYYSNTYFGLNQSIEIDSLRCAIERFKDSGGYYALLCSLYYAMKEVVFAKDGHMAQPLNPEANGRVLLNRREKSVTESFLSKIKEFGSADFVTNNFDNPCYQYTLTEILDKGIIDQADLVYADPPYTDMQYSRYFHLLETVTKYDYPELSFTNGKVSTGLYRADRYQSPLSQRSKAKAELEKLIAYCAGHDKKLIFSYAYPVNPQTEKKDRYTTSVTELTEIFGKHFGKEHVALLSVDFAHCNNRNSETKKVYEYLIVGNPDQIYEAEGYDFPDGDEAVKKTIEEINATVGTNVSPIYNSHLYWSQKPYNVCDILLKNLSEKGDIVCDPFMGSGVTVLEALSKDLARRPIGVEINDYPIFILKSLLEKHDKEAFKKEADLLIKELSKTERELYPAVCPVCGKAVTLEKSSFSYIQDGKKKLDAVYARCNACKKNFTSLTKDDESSFSKYDNEEFHHFENIDLIPDSRIAVRENETLYDIFTKRNIKAIDSILAAIENKTFYRLYIYSLVGIMHLCKICDPKSSSQWPLWTPNRDCVEKNVIKLFIKSLNKTREAISAADEKLLSDRHEARSFSDLREGGYYILKDGVQSIENDIIPDESVDLIITDPPYLGHVVYSEYMQLYKPFLKTEIEYDKEIIVIRTKNRVKTEKDYFNDLDAAFAQISRSLKKGKYLCLYFHDANLKIWASLVSVLKKNNLLFVGITHVNKGKSTLKNLVSPKKSMNGDALLFFKKGVAPIKKQSDFSEHEVIKIARGIVADNDGQATTAKLYDDGVLAYLIRTDTLGYCASKYSDLTEIFAKGLSWVADGGFWTL